MCGTQFPSGQPAPLTPWRSRLRVAPQSGQLPTPRGMASIRLPTQLLALSCAATLVWQLVDPDLERTARATGPSSPMADSDGDLVPDCVEWPSPTAEVTPRVRRAPSRASFGAKKSDLTESAKFLRF